MQAQAQAFVFFVAGYETTSSTITYCLYELALNPEIQEKLYAEIEETCNKPGGLTYERVINEFEYLHMVFNGNDNKELHFFFIIFTIGTLEKS